MNSKKLHILYVDDESINLRLFQQIFKREFNIFTAICGKEALNILKNKTIDVVITDQMMPEMTGVELLKVLKSNFPQIPPSRIILSGLSKEKVIDEAFSKYNLFAFISKPWQKENLLKTIYNSINLRNYGL